MNGLKDFPPRTCGFRFSPTDAVVILLGAATTVALWPLAGLFSLVLPVAFGHFFLFCNVFRIQRKLELIWAAAFVANVLAWTVAGQLDWILVLSLQTPVTVSVIAVEILSPRYHGILSRQINRRHLDDYLSGMF